MLAFASLGRWQLGRMHEKQAMLDAVQAVLGARDARPLSAAAGPAQGYDWVAGEGVFAEPLILLDNQQRDGRAGVRAFRVFDPQDGVQPGVQAPPLLVELGWLPLPGDRTLPQLPRPEGTHAIAGLLVPPPSQGLGRAVLAAQEDGTLLATGLDIDRLRDMLGLPSLAPRLLKLDPALPLGHARDLDILPNTLPPEKHLGYAVQWFGLALAVLVTALVLTFRKRRP
ncbi:SURF1 family protein [Luteimonas aestuarii]|uniref:SURF1-like protein n=1 Tax=Luteimonas aestuarii TaxID=453837 RepID=A0A4R5TRK2_9GAMM|nr:SURF1 family protein [Luteimonas aestuarii]TDK23048.1 SURF1 family protein [Luteimonas aestuarii]